MGHSHDHGESLTGRRLVLSIFLTLAFVAGEAIAGYFAHSLALLSDAGHNFADALALIISWYGIWIARKPSTQKRTFGYHRVGILAALVNAVSLVVIALLIFWEAIARLRNPGPVHSTPMIVVALIAIVMNTIISLWLRGDAQHDLNVRSAYMHIMGDAISAAGVLHAVTDELEHRFRISHSTIQIEVEGCDPNDMYCIARATKHNAEFGHRH